jgi:hypothetical protein
VFSRESLADGESGVSEAAMKGRWKEAIGSGEGGQEVGEGRTTTIACPFLNSGVSGLHAVALSPESGIALGY